MSTIAVTTYGSISVSGLPAPGVKGDSSYTYIAYASDAAGAGFTLTYNAALDYIAILATDTAIETPEAADFAGLWKNYKGATGPAGDGYFTIALSDLTSALEIGQLESMRMPFAFTLTGVRASLLTAQTSGDILTLDIKEGGVSILSTLLTIDNDEKTSTTADVAAVISDASLADDAEITFHLEQIGTGATGLKVTLLGYAT